MALHIRGRDTVFVMGRVGEEEELAKQQTEMKVPLDPCILFSVPTRMLLVFTVK